MNLSRLIHTTLILLISGNHAFAFTRSGITNFVRSTSTTLYIDKKTADMIDMELLRQKDRATYDRLMKSKKDPLVEKMKREYEQNRPIPEFFEGPVMGSGADTIEKIRDKRMLRNDPERYCADRCLATGHCDVLEDFFEMDAKQVVEFCEECVLGDNEECDIPDSMYNNDYPDFALRP